MRLWDQFLVIKTHLNQLLTNGLRNSFIDVGRSVINFVKIVKKLLWLRKTRMLFDRRPLYIVLYHKRKLSNLSIFQGSLNLAWLFKIWKGICFCVPNNYTLSQKVNYVKWFTRNLKSNQLQCLQSCIRQCKTFKILDVFLWTCSIPTIDSLDISKWINFDKSYLPRNLVLICKNKTCNVTFFIILVLLSFCFYNPNYPFLGTRKHYSLNHCVFVCFKIQWLFLAPL